MRVYIVFLKPSGGSNVKINCWLAQLLPICISYGNVEHVFKASLSEMEYNNTCNEVCFLLFAVTQVLNYLSA